LVPICKDMRGRNFRGPFEGSVANLPGRSDENNHNYVRHCSIRFTNPGPFEFAFGLLIGRPYTYLATFRLPSNHHFIQLPLPVISRSAILCALPGVSVLRFM
jgi:hypothetical protein